MYNFILSMWKQGKITVEYLETLVANGKLTAKEAKAIKAESQANNG